MKTPFITSGLIYVHVIQLMISGLHTELHENSSSSKFCGNPWKTCYSNDETFQQPIAKVTVNDRLVTAYTFIEIDGLYCTQDRLVPEATTTK
jgi:hypothetical protein